MDWLSLRGSTDRRGPSSLARFLSGFRVFRVTPVTCPTRCRCSSRAGSGRAVVGDDREPRRVGEMVREAPAWFRSDQGVESLTALLEPGSRVVRAASEVEGADLPLLTPSTLRSGPLGPGMARGRRHRPAPPPPPVDPGARTCCARCRGDRRPPSGWCPDGVPAAELRHRWRRTLHLGKSSLVSESSILPSPRPPRRVRPISIATDRSAATFHPTFDWR